MTTTLTHECNGDRSRGAVCSHLLDSRGDLLTSLGYAVQTTDKVCGSKVVTREGDTYARARYNAWAAGVVRVCTRTGNN